MDRNDLLNLLNLKKPTEAPRSLANAAPKQTRKPLGTEKAALTPPSPTAVVQDAWDAGRGVTLSQRYSSLNTLPVEAIADFHTMAFAPSPEVVESCADARRLEYVQTLLETPEYQALHSRTMLNAIASEAATVELSKGYLSLTERDKKDATKTAKEKAAGKGDPSKEAARQEAALVLAAGEAAEKAGDKVMEVQERMAALGMGGDGAVEGTRLDADAVAATFQRIQNNAFLQDIFNRAGKMRRFAQGKQRQKCRHGYEDMVGVTLDDNVDHLIDEELVQLLDEDFGDDTLRRLVEKETLALDYRGEEKVGKGPVVCCVDESGSMTGDKIKDAKAFALTLAWMARHQNRYCVLVGYSGGTEGTVCVLKPGKWDENELLDWLTHFFSGGTDMDVPLDVLPNKIWPEIRVPRGKSDLIVVTDAVCHVPPAMRDNFNAWKTANKARVISLILNRRAGDLEAVSEEVHLVPRLGLGVGAVEGCLSL